MKNFYAVITNDGETVYISLFSNRNDAKEYTNLTYDADTENMDNFKRKHAISGVFDINSCNKYLKSVNGCVVEFFDGAFLV